MREGGALRVEQSTSSLHEVPGPAEGPRILFFTGGSALRGLSQRLKMLTWNSVHIVSSFDSGGSSARLREAFHMIAVGDIRNRLLSLMDEDHVPNAQAAHLLAQRLPRDEAQDTLRQRLARLADGSDESVRTLEPLLRDYVQAHLRGFVQRMPQEFDLRGASLGNLVLADSMLGKGGDIEATVDEFARLACVRGRVVPVAHADVTLVAALRDGSRVVGQHRITGKEVAPVRSPIQDLYLTPDRQGTGKRTEVEAAAAACDSIENANLICYPMGSFFTSVVANLLPRGIGRAIRRARCRKVYIPNTGTDPEEVGLSLQERVQVLLHTVWRDGGAPLDPSEVVDTVLLDSRRGHYEPGFDLGQIERLGLQVLDLPLIVPEGSPELDPDLLASVLMSLASESTV